jgi:hypothetical protein
MAAKMLISGQSEATHTYQGNNGRLRAICCPKRATCFGFFIKPSLGTGIDLQLQRKISI